MSAHNGDKSRHHRLRKRRIQIREAERALRKKLSEKKEEPEVK